MKALDLFVMYTANLHLDINSSHHDIMFILSDHCKGHIQNVNDILEKTLILHYVFPSETVERNFIYGYIHAFGKRFYSK